jgi:hypothetical protein
MSHQDYTSYTFKSKLELMERYAKLISELANLNIELSEVLQDEHRTKYDAWQSSQEQSVNGRDRDAVIATINLTTELHKLRGEIIALKEEKELIEFLVREGVHV